MLCPLYVQRRTGGNTDAGQRDLAAVRFINPNKRNAAQMALGSEVQPYARPWSGNDGSNRHLGFEECFQYHSG